MPNRLDTSLPAKERTFGSCSTQAMLADEVARIKALGGGGYIDVRVLDDGTIIGLGKLLFTTAIYVDMNQWGWGRRYCFDDHAKACAEYQGLQCGDDEPVGWIATRP